MNSSYRIARIAGIDVRLHVTFLMLLAFWGWQGWQAGGEREAIYQVFSVSLLFLCVLLHEFGHAFAARGYGIRTPDITLLPIGGVARLERIPEKPVQELVIAIAGPMVNVVIALVLWLALGRPTSLSLDRPFDDRSQELLFNLLRINEMLILFNLIPAFPMDGGRVLRASLSFWLPHSTATRIAARVGQGMAVIFVIVGLFGIPGYVATNPFLVFIAAFVFMGAQQEATYARLRAAADDLRVADAMVSHFRSFPDDTPVLEAAREAQTDAQSIYPITDADMRALGAIPRNELLQIAPTLPPHATIGSLAHTIPTVTVDSAFGAAFSLMRESGSPVLLVVNPTGQIVGLVSLNLLSERARARGKARA